MIWKEKVRRRWRIGLLWLGVVAAIVPGNVLAQEQADIEQVPLEALLELTVSTASKYEQKAREAPASVTVITAAEIEDFGYRTLEEVLRGVRGFYTSNDRNYSFAGVRGFSRPGDFNTKVLILVDGHTVNEYVFASSPVGGDLGIDLREVERIEVVRGPSSTLYGTSAMLAVINIVTRPAETLEGLHLMAEIGQFGRRKGGVLLGKAWESGLQVELNGVWEDTRGEDLHFEEFDAPETNNGWAEGDDEERVYHLATRLAYQGLTLHARFNRRKKWIPTASWATIFDHDDAWTVDERGFAEIRYQRPFGVGRDFMVRGYADYYMYLGSYPYEEEDGELISFDRAEGRWIGGEGQWRWDWRPNARLIAGAEVQRHLQSAYVLWDEYDTYNDFDEPFTVLSGYVQNELQVTPRLALILGLRHDSYSSAGSATTPRGALVYHPFRTGTLKLLYGSAFRAPSVFELYSFDEYSGYKASQGLEPEHVRTAELVWEHRLTPWLYGTVSLYDYRMRNLIELDIDPADSLFHYQNKGRVHARGGEGEVELGLGSGMTARISYARQRARVTETDETLTNSPRHTVKIGFRGKVSRRLRSAVELVYEGRRRTVYDTHTSPYLLANVAFRSHLFSERVGVALQVRNLFDTSYALPGGFEHVQPAIVQPRRSVTIRLDVSV